MFKIIISAAALDTNATTPAELFYDDTGKYNLNGWLFYGWAPKELGRLNISDALTWSSDPVFYELGRRIGINILGEAAGNVPTIDWDTSLQQALLAMAVANRGIIIGRCL